MWENVALCYSFSHFRQVKSGIRCENTRYVRYVRYTRFVLQDGSILVQDPISMVNYFLSTPITIFPDGLLNYKEPAEKLWDLSLRRIEDQHKIYKKHY